MSATATVTEIVVVVVVVVIVFVVVVVRWLRQLVVGGVGGGLESLLL